MIHDLSLGEVQSLCVKATRGTGRAVGVAEDAGHAVRWLLARGEDGAGALVQLLTATDRAGPRELAPMLPDLAPANDAICPLALGGYLSDMCVLPERAVGPVWVPILLLPFVSDVSPHGVDIVEDGRLVRLRPRDVARVPTQSRARVVGETLAALQAFAARTYAPATEQSRAGAGAGTSDND